MDIRNRRAEIGQDTTQVPVSDGSVQLTVTSCEPGPVYIRFMDEDMNVFGTDVDECDTCSSASGADVVGLDSQGKLEMNIEKTLTAEYALAYDQYTLVENALTATSFEQYLAGEGRTYYQGKFRFIDPCSMAGDHFFVRSLREVREGLAAARKRDDLREGDLRRSLTD